MYSLDVNVTVVVSHNPSVVIISSMKSVVVKYSVVDGSTIIVVSASYKSIVEMCSLDVIVKVTVFVAVCIIETFSD